MPTARLDIGNDVSGSVIIQGEGNVVVFNAVRTREAVEERVNRAAVAGGRNPYVGLAAFQESDAAYFFGREKLVEKIHRKAVSFFEGLAELQDEALIRLLTIYGPSGSGKSSVARAGLIPALALKPIPGCRRSRVAIFTPGASPLQSLAAVLARMSSQETSAVRLVREFSEELTIKNSRGAFDGLTRIVGTLPELGESALFIFVDQFEEAFSLCQDQEQRLVFIENLLYAASDRSNRVAVVLTLRSDFLRETQQYLRLNEAIAEHGMLVPAMSRAELEEAIRRPAESTGRPLDNAVVELLAAETAGEEGSLPLLQFALERIWENIGHGKAPEDTLKELGGVGGALASEAQSLFEQLDEADKRIIKRAFLSFIQLGEGSRDTRRSETVENMVPRDLSKDHVEKLLRLFANPNKRLITLSADDSGKVMATLAHEALIEHWSTLQHWVDADRENIRFHRRLSEAARDWGERGRPTGLLWRQPNLDLLRSFTRKSERDLTEIEDAFAHGSDLLERTQKRRFWGSLAALFVAGLGIMAVLLHENYKSWRVTRPWATMTNLRTGEVRPLSERVAQIGRKTAQTQHLNYQVASTNTVVSRIHLSIFRDFTAMDMRSRYGTMVNAIPLPYGDSRVLQTGDLVATGGVELYRFQTIDYRPVDFLLRPGVPEMTTTGAGWGALVEGTTRTVTFLDQPFYSLSVNEENAWTVVPERVDTADLWIYRCDHPRFVTKVWDEQARMALLACTPVDAPAPDAEKYVAIVVKHLSESAHLRVELQINDYTNLSYGIPVLDVDEGIAGFVIVEPRWDNDTKELKDFSDMRLIGQMVFTVRDLRFQIIPMTDL